MEEFNWGRCIRAFRKLKGFTQEDFANQLGISVSVLGEIERGNRKPTEEFLAQVTDTLNMTLEELRSIK